MLSNERFSSMSTTIWSIFPRLISSQTDVFFVASPQRVADQSNNSRAGGKRPKAKTFTRSADPVGLRDPTPTVDRPPVSQVNRRGREISRGRFWSVKEGCPAHLDEIAAGIVTDVRQIAARENCSARKISTTILLALYDAQAEWSRQYRMLAFFQAVRQVAYRP